jgi:hypothetical protein
MTDDPPDLIWEHSQYRSLQKLEKHRVKKTLSKKVEYKHCVFHQAIYSSDWSRLIMNGVKKVTHTIFSHYKISSGACPRHNQEKLREEYAF